MQDKVVFELTAEHIRLLSELNVRATFYAHEEVGVLPAIDTKRLFGNSTTWHEVARILELKPEKAYSEDELMEGKDAEEGYPYGYSPEQVLYCKQKIAELIPALDVVLKHRTFAPGKYELDSYGAYYHYLHAKNYLVLQPLIHKVEERFQKECPKLHEFAMNISDENVYESYFEELCFGSEKQMRAKKIDWLNAMLDELKEIIASEKAPLDQKISGAKGHFGGIKKGVEKALEKIGR